MEACFVCFAVPGTHCKVQPSDVDGLSWDSTRFGQVLDKDKGKIFINVTVLP